MNIVDAIDSQAKKEVTKHIISDTNWNKLMRRFMISIFQKRLLLD